MISLSSIYHGQTHIAEKKQIKLRPVKASNDDDSNLHHEKEAEHQRIQDDLVQAQNELERIRKQQAEMVEKTNAEIEAAKANWETEKQQWIEQAKEEGYADGFEKGKWAGLDQYKQLIAQANDIVASATKDYHSVIGQTEESILELALQSTEKIIHHKLDEHPDAFLSIVRAAVKDLKDKPELTIYVHPSHFERVTEQRNALAEMFGGDRGISVYADADADKNSCLVKHAFGQVEAGVDEQLAELRKTLKEISAEQDEE
ncbi:flagellar assembly protein FliH [Lentibacillus lipolyticus]|nr:flagellar assembly protein FliH [Lentibacillus lipolyticus]